MFVRRIKIAIRIIIGSLHCIILNFLGVFRDNIDVLFYLSFDGQKNRYDLLRKKLSSLGITSECVSESIRESASKLHVLLPFNFRYITKNIFAINYYLQKFKPKILCIEDDQSPKFLYEFLRYKNILLCNIAHGISGKGDYFSSRYYDLYFVFGQTSLQNIESNLCALHNPGINIIVAGSPFFQRKNSECAMEMSMQRQVSVMPAQETIGIAGAYFHSSFPTQERYFFDQYYSNLCDFVVQKKETLFLYKQHIVGEIPALENKLLTYKNVCLFTESMFDLAKCTDLVVMTASCSSIECACAKTPFVIYQWEKDRLLIEKSIDLLMDTRYFKRAKSLKDLFELVDYRILKNNIDTVKLEEYYKMHIDREDSVDFIAANISDVIRRS